MMTAPLKQLSPAAYSRRVAAWSDNAASARRTALGVAFLAVRSLHIELSLHPKPGLVTPLDNGSHHDMDAATFMRSLFTLRHYFKHICQAGMREAPFKQLKQLGIEAEARMLAATGGVNTHRGAIFSLGLLCAAAGCAHARRLPPTPATLRALLLANWGAELACHSVSGADSHGLRAAALHAASGAREEGARGLPSVFEIGVPALQATLARGGGAYHARIDALFTLMAHISDTNVLHRGGARGALLVRLHARRFIDNGGTAHSHWQTTAQDCHRRFVRHRLSPGGAADLLAASCLVLALSAHEPA